MEYQVDLETVLVCFGDHFEYFNDYSRATHLFYSKIGFKLAIRKDKLCLKKSTEVTPVNNNNSRFRKYFQLFQITGTKIFLIVDSRGADLTKPDFNEPIKAHYSDSYLDICDVFDNVESEYRMSKNS